MEAEFISRMDWLLFTGASISLVMPFIPVYVEQLGTPKSQVELFLDWQFLSRRLLLRLLHRFGEI